eukprot:4344351-Pyramimonas_sp.AAC.1
MHRRSGSMRSPFRGDVAEASHTSTTHRPPVHRRRIADASLMHRQCIGDAARSSDPIYSGPI